MKGSSERSAYFHSLIAYFDGSALSVSEGIARGRISEVIAGDGWGYDPIFVPDGSTFTFAQLKAEKNKFSHRKKALEEFAKWLRARK
jgi:XTP/dITP diphosphohydrolase